jgi:hypothetical protein
MESELELLRGFYPENEEMFRGNFQEAEETTGNKERTIGIELPADPWQFLQDGMSTSYEARRGRG